MLWVIMGPAPHSFIVLVSLIFVRRLGEQFDAKSEFEYRQLPRRKCEIETPRLPCRSIWTKGQLWPPKLRVYALYECRDAGEEGWQVEISQKLLMPSAKADARGTRRIVRGAHQHCDGAQWHLGIGRRWQSDPCRHVQQWSRACKSRKGSPGDRRRSRSRQSHHQRPQPWHGVLKREAHKCPRFRHVTALVRILNLGRRRADPSKERHAARHANVSGPLIARVLSYSCHFGASFIFWRTSSRLKLAAFCRCGYSLNVEMN